MNEIKTDLFPESLRKGEKNGESRKEKERNGTLTNVVLPDKIIPVDPLPESERPRKDGPGGE